MSNPTISIIIPVFNVEKFIYKTLLSVKNQTKRPDEVIIINDGSTDNSFNIIKKFSYLSNWKILQTLNQGLGLTRNFGLSKAKSKYIYFLDADDIIEKNLILEMKQLIKKYQNPDLILFSGKTFSHKKKINHKKTNLKFTIDGQFFQGDNLLTKLVQKKETLPQSSRYITKKKLWIKNNLYYPKGIAEDEGLFFPLIAHSKNTVVKKKTYYRYRVNRPGSITTKKVKPIHAKDYLNRILFTLDFMKSQYNIVKFDYSAWCYNLERKTLKYINLCLKTNLNISWKLVIKIFFKTRNIFFLIKIFWRIFKKI